MTPQQIQLVQSTWKMVVPIADTAAVLFYDRMFVLDPSLAPLFGNDMAEQRRRVMTMIGVAVTGLTRVDTIVPVLKGLGARHVGYGVKDEHYATVGSALLWTLQIGLKEKFTPEVREAWAAAYTLLSDVMKLGAMEKPRMAA